jgi:hypothetical protein
VRGHIEPRRAAALTQALVTKKQKSLRQGARILGCVKESKSVEGNKAYLLEAEVGVDLAEAAAGDVEAVLADEAAVVAGDAAIEGKSGVQQRDQE